MRKLLALAACGVLVVGVAACGDDDNDSGGGGGSDLSNLSGTIKIDGSSTVEPFASAAAEQFSAQAPNVRVTVAASGTGGGFEKFCAGETSISDASRPIKPDEEAPACKKNGIRYEEVQVANDGIAVVTNKDLKIDCLTVDQLKQLWNKDSRVSSYDQIDPKLPDAKAELFGAGTDSGTFDFFTDKINGEEGVSRDDYQPSENDNITVQGVEGARGGLGYFGFSYYEGNASKLNLVGIDDGKGCVKPNVQNIQDGSYYLSRPLFMYPNEQDLAKPEVRGFMDYVLENEAEIAEASQIVPLTSAQLDKGRSQLKEAEAAAG
jgi:phosphate transport system substrate-binding protein